jgi:hypothetical protein
LRSDRHVATTRRGATSVTGDIVGELSFGTYDDLLQAAFCGTWATDVLVTGTTSRSFSILKRNLDIGVDTIYTGCEINQFKLSAPLQDKITVTFSVIGSAEAAYTVPVGATFTSKTDTDYMTTFDGSISVAGGDIAYATTFDCTLDNALVAKYSLMQRAAYTIKQGMIGVSGSMSAYIEDDTLKAKYRDEVDTAMVLTMVDSSGGNPNSYKLTLPRCRFTSATDQNSGDDLVIQQLNYESLLDSSAATELKLERIAAS